MTRTPMVAMAAVLACATAVDAHPRLQSANPAPSGGVLIAPTAVRLHFSEALIGRFSTLRLSDSAGRPVPTGPSALDPRDHHTLAAPIPSRLARGRYTVNWRVVSVDTHRVQGRYGFTVSR